MPRKKMDTSSESKKGTRTESISRLARLKASTAAGTFPTAKGELKYPEVRGYEGTNPASINAPRMIKAKKPDVPEKRIEQPRRLKGMKIQPKKKLSASSDMLLASKRK